jgi:hypothetical protein
MIKCDEVLDKLCNTARSAAAAAAAADPADRAAATDGVVAGAMEADATTAVAWLLLLLLHSAAKAIDDERSTYETPSADRSICPWAGHLSRSCHSIHGLLIPRVGQHANINSMYPWKLK